MESRLVKTESQKEHEDHVKDKNNSKFKDMEGKKRKNSVNSDMDLEDSQNSSTVKRMRYSTTKIGSSRNSHNTQSLENKKNFEVLIINIPGEWSFQEITNFVKDECDVDGSRITNIVDENSESDFRIQLEFETKEELQQALKKLQKKEAEGKLFVYSYYLKHGPESDAESDSTLCLEEWDPKQAESNGGSSNPDEDDNFYIREEYLESLGIKSPITNWVHVTDFRCDKSELKDVLELAGSVLVCSVCTISTKYANVMYSHPLEALQAVSMLNGQQYYGKVLKVKMISVSGDKPLLPKGLLNVGPGLGKRGKPLPDIGEQYKRFVRGKSSNLDACLFQKSLLKRIGLTVDDEVYKLARNISTANSEVSNSDNMDIERSKSPIDKQNTQYNRINEFGPTGQNREGKNIPVIRSQTLNRPLNKTGPRAHIPVAHPSPMQLPLRGQISGPLGPRVPIAAGSVGPTRPGFPIAPNRPPGFPHCPPIPGIESGSDPRATNGAIPGQIPPGQCNVGLGHIANPRGPMPNPIRFPGPINTMLGPRPVGPVIGPHGPIAIPNGPMVPPLTLPNVQMFKGPDPTMVQMINLPLNTNFMNLCGKLAEYGQVVFLELTAPGCANVRFTSPAEADRCLQNFRIG